MKLFHSLLLISLIACAACHHSSYDPRLTGIYLETSGNPEKALSMLDSIDFSSLSTRDRHYYDFLTIKAADKAYITHTSDSLILDVIGNYSKRDPLYPELLYYAGRVNCDLGDLPSALSYFQHALDLIPEDDNKSELKRNLLSQMGGLFSDLRLYDDAITYMEKSLIIDRENNDTLGLALDLQVTAMIYLNTPHIDKAETAAREALKWGRMISEEEIATAQMYLAAVKYKKGEYDSALNLMRDLPALLPPTCHNYAKSYLSDIYFEAGKLDSAYFTAREIINFSMDDNKKNAYALILSPEMRGIVPADSIDRYQQEYSQVLENYFNRYESQQALIQNSFYNYREKKRLEAETSRKHLIIIISIISVSLLLLIILLLILKYRNKSQKLRLHETLERLRQLENSIHSQKNSLYSRANEDTPDSNLTEIKELQEKLKTKIAKILSDSHQTSEIFLLMMQSPAYSKLQQLISDKKALNDDNPLWEELEDSIYLYSEHFKERIQILLGRDITNYEYKVAILIKYGISPSNISSLLCKGRSTISYYRSSLKALKFDKDTDTTIDDIIRVL